MQQAHFKKIGSVMILSLACAFAAHAQDKKPNVVVIGTGGTIAGAGASSVNTAAYQSAVVPVDLHIKGCPPRPWDFLKGVRDALKKNPRAFARG